MFNITHWHTTLIELNTAKHVLITIVLTAISESASQDKDFKAYSKTWLMSIDVNTITETIDLIIDDNEVEDSETLRLDLTDSNSVGSVTAVIITIQDNDQGKQLLYLQ